MSIKLKITCLCTNIYIWKKYKLELTLKTFSHLRLIFLLNNYQSQYKQINQKKCRVDIIGVYF